MKDISALVDSQRAFFKSGLTRDPLFRKRMLRRLGTALAANEKQIFAALEQDLKKSVYEGYLSEVGLVRDEIRFTLRRMGRWSRPKRVPTPLLHFPAASYIYPEPRGVALIISPWNYPILLTLGPLIGALAAGNCCVLKPSEFSPETSAMISEMIAKYFRPEEVAVVEGDAETSVSLLEQKFDIIFFTGSTAVGKRVMAAAAKHLTPVTLELGGKSPTIVDADVDVDLAARRIAGGKWINAGQTCIAPDYLLVADGIRDRLLARIIEAIRGFFGDRPRKSPDYARIVNHRHFDRLAGLMEKGNILFGGETDRSDLFIGPTLIDGVDPSDPVMQEEIFGPILPVIPYRDLDAAISFVTSRPRPLALYFFSRNPARQKRILREISFGGGCINDTLLHIASPYLPFGGVGRSGFGSYHGKAGFDAFSHRKSVMKRFFLPDAPLRFPPFRGKLKFLKSILR